MTCNQWHDQLVLSEVHLVDASGSVIHIAQRNNSVAAGTVTSPTLSAREESGWVTYASWMDEATAMIESYSAS